MRKLLLIAFLFIAGLASAQSFNVNIGGISYTSGAGVPGSCHPNGSWYFNQTNSTWYQCISGTWTSTNGGGGGSGTVNIGTATHGAYYATSTNAVSDAGSATVIFGGVTTGGSNGGLSGTEGTGAGLTAGAGTDLLYPDSTSHCWHQNLNNTDYGCVPFTLESGTVTVTGDAPLSGACASEHTLSITGLLTTDIVEIGFNGDPSGVTGIAPTTNGGVYILAYPKSAGTAGFKVCNDTSATITVGTLVLNVKVRR